MFYDGQIVRCVITLDSMHYDNSFPLEEGELYIVRLWKEPNRPNREFVTIDNMAGERCMNKRANRPFRFGVSASDRFEPLSKS